MKKLPGCFGIEMFYEKGSGDCLKCKANRKGMCRIEVETRKKIEEDVINNKHKRMKKCTEMLNREEL